MDKAQLKIDQIVPGMTLAEPITNASGVTLMPAGIRLTPMFIARIRKWNIETLDVLVEKRNADGARRDTTVRKLPDAAASARARQKEEENALPAGREEFARATAMEISKPFVNVKANPLMMQLRASVIKKLVAHGKNGIVNILRRAPEEQSDPEQRENA